MNVFSKQFLVTAVIFLIKVALNTVQGHFCKCVLWLMQSVDNKIDQVLHEETRAN